MVEHNTKADKVHIVWCSPHPTHYNAYLFDHLVEIKTIDFDAVYFSKTLTKYPWKRVIESKYRVTYLQKFLGIDWTFIWNRLTASNELLVIAGWNEPTALILALCFALTGQKFILYSDTPELKERKGLKFWLRKFILRFLFKKTFKFFVTGKQGLINAELIGVPQCKLINLPFATNIDFFVPIPAEQKDQYAIHFISSGRLDNSHKAYDIAIEAFERLKKQFPQYNFHYSLAGDGPDKNKLESLIKAKGLQKEVSLLGWLEAVDLLPFYQSGDVFLHPSHFDPFPNAVLEAMACGLPVIGSNAAGSVLDRVVDGESGYIHQDNSVPDLFQKLSWMCNQPIEGRLLMGKKAREMAELWSVSYHTRVIEGVVHDYKKEMSC